jgi:hypothetical protein
MKATFEHSVHVLVKAYLNGTLEHMKCSACAVGNLVAAANNFKFYKEKERLEFSNDDGYVCYLWKGYEKTHWQDVFMTSGGHQEFEPGNYHGESKRQIDSTGYSFIELARIEYAFETAPGKPNLKHGDPPHALTLDETWMFNGLMAVVDVLADISSNRPHRKRRGKEALSESIVSPDPLIF